MILVKVRVILFWEYKIVWIRFLLVLELIERNLFDSIVFCFVFNDENGDVEEICLLYVLDNFSGFDDIYFLLL